MRTPDARLAGRPSGQPSSRPPRGIASRRATSFAGLKPPRTRTLTSDAILAPPKTTAYRVVLLSRRKPVAALRLRPANPRLIVADGLAVVDLVGLVIEQVDHAVAVAVIGGATGCQARDGFAVAAS